MDRALALSSPTELTSSASFSPSIRISLRLKIHQAQAKNFCRVLDIRVSQIMKTMVLNPSAFEHARKAVFYGHVRNLLTSFIGKHQSWRGCRPLPLAALPLAI